MNTYNIFRKLALFSDLTPVERDEMLRAAHIKDYKKGTYIFHRGDSVDKFYVVADGAVRLHRETPDGKDVTLQIAILGDTLGEHEIFENKTHFQASAITAEDSHLIEYPVQWMKQKIREHSSLALNMLALISQSSSRLSVDKEHLVTLKTPQRIACFLLRLCSLHELNPAHFTLPYSKITIASKLGMEPESFSRALAKLKEIGVSVQGNDIQISNAMALENYSCSLCSMSEDCDTCQYHQRLVGITSK